jgi:hypothetical protein
MDFVECPICLAPPIQAVLTPCGHVSESLISLSYLEQPPFKLQRPHTTQTADHLPNPPPLSRIVACGACLFSTLKTQAIRERRPPNPTGQLPTSGPGMKKPRGKADQEAWFRRFGADPKTGRIRGKILTGSCPVSFGLGLSLSLSCLSRMGEESELRERGSCRLASTRDDLLWNQDKEADLDPGYYRGDGFAGLPARYRRRTRTTRGRRVYIPRDMYRLFGLIIGWMTSPEFR